MHQVSKLQDEILNDGFTVVENIYDADEIRLIIETIDQVDKSKATFRKTDDLFAIRQFLKEIPQVSRFIFNNKIKEFICGIFGEEYFIVKSIYFDKPEKSNWFVAWHQDLTISVDKKVSLPGYGPWTVKFNQFAVQPPLDILQDNFTVRIHLDDTDENNGALRVIPGSHLKGVLIVHDTDWKDKPETICDVEEGGIMIMRPLLMHASNRSIANKKRRVIHIEFSKANLPKEIQWGEKGFVSA
jgi:ectoine hydroxylase-related dioxygenase (phytanoyl-CoA dioxygenase family)